MSEFEPYEDWLGIPRGIRPINHYLLLGIPVFESSAEAIVHACDQRMGMIRNFQSGPRGEYASRLMNELAMAKQVLLDDEQRQYYDAEVRLVAKELNRSFEQQAFHAGQSNTPEAVGKSEFDQVIRSDLSQPNSVGHFEVSEKVDFDDQPVELEPNSILSVKYLSLFAMVAVAAMLATIFIFRPTNESDNRQTDAQPVEPLEQPAGAIAQPQIELRPKTLVAQTSAAELLLSPSLALLDGAQLQEGNIGNWQRSGDSATWHVNVTERRTGFFWSIWVYCG